MVLVGGREPDAALAARDPRATAASASRPYKRIRRIEFAELPKTISGKIRRVELRTAEEARPPGAPRNAAEWSGGGGPGRRG